MDQGSFPEGGPGDLAGGPDDRERWRREIDLIKDRLKSLKEMLR